MTRDQILSEIRRTAAENGGAPLGRQRFLAATGIKESDWSGKYWSRWSDAVLAAGLTPNSKQSAIPDRVLLAKLAEFTIQLGHFPTRPELRMKARNEPGFPHPNTFERLGRKAALAARLLEFSVENPDFGEVVSIMSQGGGIEPSSTPARPSGQDSGFVYLLKAGRFHKIGLSNTLERRQRDLAIQLPERASLVHSIRTDDPVGIERYWHQRFADRRANGEWFQLTAADVAAFRRRKFM